MIFSVEILNAMIGQLSAIKAPVLRIHGVNEVLMEIPLPDPWFTKPNGGAVHKTGDWSGVGIQNGRATWFEIVGDGGRIEGKVGTDLLLNNINITTGRKLTITKFSVRLST